jgi:hypothetical protein
LSISATNQAALEAGSAKDIYFVFLDLAGDPWRACTGTRSYTTLGESWLGIGEIAGISELVEASDVAARPVTLSLSGVDPFIVEPVLSRTNYKGRTATIYRGFLDGDEALLDAPFPVWTGRMDVGSVSFDKGLAVAQMQCEPLAARLLRPNISRYSDQDHQLRWPGDRFYEYLPQMAQKDVVWGGARVGGGWGDYYTRPDDGGGPDWWEK